MSVKKNRLEKLEQFSQSRLKVTIEAPEQFQHRLDGVNSILESSGEAPMTAEEFKGFSKQVKEAGGLAAYEKKHSGIPSPRLTPNDVDK